MSFIDIESFGITGFLVNFLFLVLIIAVGMLIVNKNRRLDELVRQRTDELEAFNQKLQDEVNKAVEKNRTQEKILMQQAKMAEIGSMVESIAHQWRQPLNILGLSMSTSPTSSATIAIWLVRSWKAGWH